MEEVKAELTAQLENPVAFTIPVLGGIPVSQSVVVSWIIMAALTLAAILLTRNLKPVPRAAAAGAGEFVGLINNFSRDIIGKEWRRFAPWLGTAALYITCANLIGLVGLVPPHQEPERDGRPGLSCMVVIYTAAFRVHGVRGGFGQFLKPSPVMLPINIMEVAIRPPVSVHAAVRQCASRLHRHGAGKNGGAGGGPGGLQPVLRHLDGIIQTIVFVFLTAIFIGEALEEE